MSRNENAYRIIEHLKTTDCTHSQLVHATGVAAATVSRWLKIFIGDGDAHVVAFVPTPYGGPDSAVYRWGPKPKNFRISKRQPIDAKTRAMNYRTRLRNSGEWEHVLAMRRAEYRANNPKRDSLTAAFFTKPPVI